MFRIQNQATGAEEEFDNRDALFLGLEREENRCLQLNTSATFHLFHQAKDGTVLESKELTIPSQNQENMAEYLGDFGLKKQDKKIRFFSRQQKAPKSKEEEASPVVQAEKTDERTGNRVSRWQKGIVPFLLLATLVISFLSLYVSIQAVKHRASSSQTVTQASAIDHGSDVFCRYFISHYFGNTDERADYLADTVSLSDLTVDKATPVSVLLEKETVSKKTDTLTYVITLQSEEGTYTTQRLTLTVQKTKKASYGYLITKQPRVTAYP